MNVTAPLIVFIVFATIYGLFDLIVRRRERMAIIEKLGDKLDPIALDGKMNLRFFTGNKLSFGALKAGCLLLGIGLGLLVGFFICSNMIVGYGTDSWKIEEIASIVYGACMLIFGGIGLVSAFCLEMKYSRKE